MNLVPKRPGRAPNYWCTWHAQHPMWYLRTDDEYARFDYLKATDGGNAPRNFMCERSLFEAPGWVPHFWPSIRADLYFCLDDGWDVPFNVDVQSERWRFGSLILNPQRFPGFPGNPAERLARLNEHVKQLGWRGLALWVACQCEGDGRDGKVLDDNAMEAYWRERARWCAAAGVEYWKVDWGKRAGDASFRKLLTRIAREEAPGLLIEHAHCMLPLNNVRGSGGFSGWPEAVKPSLKLLSFSDVFRSYDVIAELETPTTLDRVVTWGAQVQVESPAQGIINCENDVYLGAVLGCALGILRVPVKNPWTQWQWPGIDEAVRAVRWQRLAPAFGFTQAELRVSPNRLTDSARINPRHWWREVSGKLVTQSAPAVVSRGVPLPEVAAAGEPPYVLASRNPSGAHAIAALPRCLEGKSFLPLADVALDVGAKAELIGVFGKFRKLVLRRGGDAKSCRIWAQDLAGDEAVEITSRAVVSSQEIAFDGELLAQLGSSAGTPEDRSLPGLVLKLDRIS